MLLDDSDGTDARRVRVGAHLGTNRGSGIAIEGAQLTVVSAGYADGDTNCCFSQRIVDTFTCDGTSFVRRPRTVTRLAAVAR